MAGRRERVSELALKLDNLQMPREKPSFDLIYETKIRHERVHHTSLLSPPQCIFIPMHLIVVIGGNGRD